MAFNYQSQHQTTIDIFKTKEDELAANASYDYKFNKTEDGDFLGKVTFGLNERIKSRGLSNTI
jgi:hypothetical protein